MIEFLISSIAFVVIVALCVLVYNLLLAPILGRPASMMPFMDLLIVLIFVGIVIFALQASGLWEKIVSYRP
ncbi:MAG: hypothetical protein WA432_00795 [Candidatus Babeliaceae bacterium]